MAPLPASVSKRIGPMILSIQYLRALAALLVITAHVSDKVGAGPLYALRHIGNVGVDLFFVVSGFIIWLTTHLNKHGVQEFIERRVVRIVPYYWLVTLLAYVVLVHEPNLVNNKATSLEHLLKSLFFIASPHPAVPDRMWPVVIPGWTLNYEVFFYAVFALILFLPAAIRFRTMIGSLSAVILGGMVYDLGNPYKFYASPMLLEFGAGVILADMYQSRKFRSKSAPPIALFVGLLVLAIFGLEDDPSDGVRFFIWGLPAIGIVYAAVFHERNTKIPYSAAIKVCGDASYSLYLTQFISIPFFFQGSMFLFGSRGDFHTVYTLSGLCFACIVGLGAFLFIERPLVIACRKLTRGRKPSQPRLAG